MSAPRFPELFPVAIGNEEETMLMTGADEQQLDDPTRFVGMFEEFIPDDVKTATDSIHYRYFLQNGGVVYNGGTRHHKPVNLERATPECATPSEVATHVQANERLLTNMLGVYVTRMAKAGEPQVARVQRRVMDSYGNSRGCHDNFEGRNANWLELLDKGYAKQAEGVLLAHLATRSFMTGAGYVQPDGVYFAQKVQRIQDINKYGYVNSAYRINLEEDTGTRFEVRCNDINISPWAIQARIGGAALLYTMLQTPLMRQLADMTPEMWSVEAKVANFKRFNAAAMDAEGQLQPTTDTLRAVDFQERSLELMNEHLEDFIELPEEYQRLIREMRYYCQDFRKVLHDELPLEALADRSDVAAKFNNIARSMQKARDWGIERYPSDIMSQAVDMRYDHIDVRTGATGKPRISYGYGYRQRDNGAFRLSPPPSAVDWAYYYPPTTTRAHIRGSLIRQEQAVDCEWGSLRLDYNDELIRLSNVLLPPSTDADDSKQ